MQLVTCWWNDVGKAHFHASNRDDPVHKQDKTLMVEAEELIKV